MTDANVVLQTLNPVHLLGGRMAVRQDLARAAVGRLASSSGMGLLETAQGVIAVVTANMARAIRVISVQRGYDPRDYTLVAFGGAGPLHAARLARELEIRRILVPRSPGILCAMGLLLTDLRTDFAVTRLATLSAAALPGVAHAFRTLEARAAAWFAEARIAPSAQRVTRTVDMRYVGQNHELPIPMPQGPIGPATLEELINGFAGAHQQNYGFVAEGEPIQLVTYRVEASGVAPKVAFRPRPLAAPDASRAIIADREIWLPEEGGFVRCPVYDRERLTAGNRIRGPSIVEQMDATTLVLPGMAARVDTYLNLILQTE